MPKMNDAEATACILVWAGGNIGLIWVLFSRVWLLRRLKPACGEEWGVLIWLLLVIVLGAGSFLLWLKGTETGGFLD
jgi:hypothetical protein